MTSHVTFKSIPGKTYNLLLLVLINFAFFYSFLYYFHTCNFRAKASLSGDPSPPIAEEGNLENTPEKHAEPTDKEQTTDQRNVSPPPAEKSTDPEVVITGTCFTEKISPLKTATKFVAPEERSKPTDKGEGSTVPQYGHTNFDNLLTKYNTYKLAEGKLVDSLVQEHQVHIFPLHISYTKPSPQVPSKLSSVTRYLKVYISLPSF